MKKKMIGMMTVACLLTGILAGCGTSSSGKDDAGYAGDTSAGAEHQDTFVLGDTTFNPENEEVDVNPHKAYSGWACIRYGVGETLFRYSDKMEIEPWLASSYERIDEKTWKIVVKDGISFSSGRMLDGEAVRECLEDLIKVHDRARNDLKIDHITAEGQTVTITTTEPHPSLLNELCDPYGCMIDMQAGITEDGLVSGTGPYVAEKVKTGEELDLVQNKNYWDGKPGYQKVVVRTISDGDTLAMALQSGEIGGAYGLPYSSYPLFQNDGYTISSTATSRTFFAHMNFESTVMQDNAVRKAIALGIDKEKFVKSLLKGNGYPAVGAFPANLPFGADAVTAEKYDPEKAKTILEEAGWKDTDGDGIREKNGKKLTIRWLTYPSRSELPLLAESAQATLGAIGFDVQINCTADHNSIREDPAAWDVYASAMVTAPTGDPAYFFKTHCLDESSANNGHYHNEQLEALAKELDVTFDAEERTELAVKMQQILLDDDAFVFCSYLKMSMITRSDVEGLIAHPCDYYEITADLRPTGQQDK